MTPPPLTVPLLRQQWQDAVFLHWQVDPETVAPLLPTGVRPDTLDGATYVGLVSFRVARSGLARGPRLLPDLVETNVRVYGVDDDERAGVVFLSMDVSSAATAAAGRLLGLPYRHSRVRMTTDADRLRSATLVPRHGPPALRSRVEVTLGPRRQAGPVEEFLTARWGLHARVLGRTRFLPNTHEAWPLREAEVVDLADDLVAAAGLPAVRGRQPDHVVHSPGVTARFGPRMAR